MPFWLKALLVSVGQKGMALAETNNGLGEAMGGQCQPRRNAAARWSQSCSTHPSCVWSMSFKSEGCGYKRLTSRPGPRSFTKAGTQLLVQKASLVSVGTNNCVPAETNNGLGEAMGGQCQPRRNAAARWSQSCNSHPSCCRFECVVGVLGTPRRAFPTARKSIAFPLLPLGEPGGEVAGLVALAKRDRAQSEQVPAGAHSQAALEMV